MPEISPLIALVDDDQDFLELQRQALENAGSRVLCFPSPKDALNWMSVEKPDLVVTDLMMSELHSGFSFSRQLKSDERFRDIPVIILTGIAGRLGFDFNPKGPGDLAAMSADAFLEKPILPAALTASVQRLLGRRARKEAES